MRILFVNPNEIRHIEYSDYAMGGYIRPFFSPALGMLISMTPNHHDLEYIDEIIGEQVDFKQRYDLVAITTTWTIQAQRAYQIADGFAKKGVPCIIGGNHASLCIEEAARYASVASGMAENMWIQILEDAERRSLRPVYRADEFPEVKECAWFDYLKIKKAIDNTQAAIDPINGLARNMRPFPILTSRGCPHTCKMCVTPEIYHRSYFAIDPELLEEQIAIAERHFKPFMYMFIDEYFGHDPRHTSACLRKFREARVKYGVQVTPNLLCEGDLAKELAETGCVVASIGLESLNTEVLDEDFGKGEPSIQEGMELNDRNIETTYLAAIRKCQEAKLPFMLFWLINPVRNTIEDMEKIVAFSKKSGAVLSSLNFAVPLPGTKFFKEQKAKGNILSYDWSLYNTFNILLKPSGGITAEAFQKAMHDNFLKLYPIGNIPGHLMGNASFSIEVLPYMVTSVAVRLEYLKKLVEKTLPFPFPLPFMPK
ncbi:MAG: radical SAM protein [Chlorobiaceae bacterium]|nr:radical SAM protein [Chlorobiaceae bacterium]